MAFIGEWMIAGETVILTLTEGDPVQGVVQAWTPAGITLETNQFYSWIIITNWVVV